MIFNVLHDDERSEPVQVLSGHFIVTNPTERYSRVHGNVSHDSHLVQDIVKRKRHDTLNSQFCSPVGRITGE